MKRRLQTLAQRLLMGACGCYGRLPLERTA